MKPETLSAKTLSIEKKKNKLKNKKYFLIGKEKKVLSNSFSKF